MNIYRNFDEIDYKKETVLTVGTFDGVHKGHQLIISRLLDNALKNNWRPVLLTFDPHPQIVLQRDNLKPVKLLTTIEERLELFEKFGLTDILIIPFSKEFAKTTPEDFVENYLIEKIGLSKILIGFDHMFGKNRGGNETLLNSMSKVFHFAIERIDALQKEGEKVSSSKIRESLETNAIKDVNDMLGHNYSVSGDVVPGDGRGRTIGLPTANINYPEHKHIPTNGVYLVKSVINGMSKYGLANIGTRPTFTNSRNTILEVYFLDFQDDLYGSCLTIEFLDFIRYEQKFKDLDSFLLQIALDKEKAMQLINKF